LIKSLGSNAQPLTCSSAESESGLSRGCGHGSPSGSSASATLPQPNWTTIVWKGRNYEISQFDSDNDQRKAAKLQERVYLLSLAGHRVIIGRRDQHGHERQERLPTQGQRINRAIHQARRSRNGRSGRRLQRRGRNSTDYTGNI
jgi:hypothetical protein